MSLRNKRTLPPGTSGAAPTAAGGFRGPLTARIEWSTAVRRLDRKRKLAEKQYPATHLIGDDPAAATAVSFNLEGIAVTPDQVAQAVQPSRALRSRAQQRLRNHVAVLLSLERCLQQQRPLTTDQVIRWYTSISSGLSTAALDGAAYSRLEQWVRQINSPQLRQPAAIQDIATVHFRILSDPLTPGFNGILARLLLRFHLGRCGMPAIRFDPQTDREFRNIDQLGHRLIELLEQSFDWILSYLGNGRTGAESR